MKKEEGSFELGKVIFHMSLDEYYNTFLAMNAPMNFSQYYQAFKPFKDIKLEGYKASEDGLVEEYQINCVIPITGVPFCNKSRLNRLVKIDRTDK